MVRDKRYPAFLVIISSILLVILLRSYPKPEKAPLPVQIKQEQPVPANQSVKISRQKESNLPVFPLDINTATQEQLMLLPGIGEKTARRIVEKREELHGFQSVEDLTEVKWIGKVKLEKIRGLVTVKHSDGPARGPKAPSEQ